ncbi:DUF2567 domain-containing protein [Plantactinospora sp. B5E13]|uniref:DUF2567 domain-containing protein n=1 Tax=unclassified Plantactinospora TaxID=2631981 RepID=UPI00325CF021
MSPATSHPADRSGGDDDRPAAAAAPSASSAPPAGGDGVTGGEPSDGPPTTELSDAPPAAEPSRRRLRGVAVNLGVFLVLILLGLPFGLVWSAVSPGVPVLQTEDGAILAEPSPEGFIAADGWFTLLGFGLGVLVTIAVWVLLRRHRGPLGMVVVVLGMLGAALVAWQVGRHIGLAGYERMLETAPAGTNFTKPPDLQAGQFYEALGFIPAIQDLLVPAFGAVLVYTLLAGWSRYPGLRPEEEPPPWTPDLSPVSSGSAVPPAPPAAPGPPGPDAAEPPRG